MHRIKLYISYLFLWPHLLCYLFCNHKEVIIQDVEVWNQRWNYAFGEYNGLLNLLLDNKWYRNIFYMRVGILSNFLNIILKKDDSFFPTKNIGGGHLFSSSLFNNN